MSMCELLRKGEQCDEPAAYTVQLRCDGCQRTGARPCCVRCAAGLRNDAEVKYCTVCGHQTGDVLVSMETRAS